MHPNSSDLIHCEAKLVDTVSELLCFRRREARVARKRYVVHLEDSEAKWPRNKEKECSVTGRWRRFGRGNVMEGSILK